MAKPDRYAAISVVLAAADYSDPRSGVSRPNNATGLLARVIAQNAIGDYLVMFGQSVGHRERAMKYGLVSPDESGLSS
jgi:hypothetical protein